MIRPPPEDFDDWEQAGCIGWGLQDVLPYFVRSERDADFGTEAYHGADGQTPDGA